MLRILIVLLIAAGVFFMSRRMPQVDKPAAIASAKFGSEKLLVSAQDFDLQGVITLIRDNKLKDAADLESKINNGSGINHVDIDKDGTVDYVKIKETRNGGAVALEFVAIPSSTQDESQAVTVAKVDFSRSAESGNVELKGGYTGNDNAYRYSMGSSLTNALFLSWLFMPSRPYYYAPRPTFFRPKVVRPFRMPMRGFRRR